MDYDFNWLTDNYPENQERYAGKWIAVCDGEVVGVGDTATEAAEQARQASPDKPYILQKIDEEVERV